MGQDSFQILLDDEEGVFFPGQIVSGRVDLKLSKEIKFRGIYLKFHGFAFLQWTESTWGNNKVTYTSRQAYFEYDTCVYGKEQTGQNEAKLPPGSYVYPFFFKLPGGIPSSFESPIGHVRYIIKARVDIPWWPDKKTKCLISVVGLVDLNKIPEATEGATATNEGTLCCFCCESGPIRIVVSLPMIGHVPGEAVNFKAEICNHSNREISCSIAELQMVVHYHGKYETKVKRSTISKVKRGKIGAGETEVWDNGELLVPATPPSSLPGRYIIDIEYFLNIRVEPSGVSLDLEVPIKIIIGSIPVRTIANQRGLTLSSASSTSSAIRGASQPFRTPTGLSQ